MPLNQPTALPGEQGRLLRLQSDVAFCAFILAACLLYDVYTLITYATTFSHGILDFAGRPVGRDFINYWTGGVAVLEGMVPEIFDLAFYHPYQERILGMEFVDHNWSYPPHMLLVVWPLGTLPYVPALVLWSVVTLLAYLWACNLPGMVRWQLVVALLLAPATFICMKGGQNGFLTAALLIGGFRLLRSHAILAGVLFGILTVKPQLGILIPFALLASRQWQAIFSAAATTVVFIGISVAVFGVESWQAYFDLVVPTQTAIMNEGKGEFLAMMPSAYIGLRFFGIEPELRSLVQGLFFLVALAGVVWTFAKSQDWVLQLAVVTVGTFMASPYAFNYDMTAVSFAIVVITLRALHTSFLPGERIVLALTWLLPITVHWFNLHNMPVGSLILTACFAILLRRVHRALGSNQSDRDGRIIAAAPSAS